MSVPDVRDRRDLERGGDAVAVHTHSAARPSKRHIKIDHGHYGDDIRVIRLRPYGRKPEGLYGARRLQRLRRVSPNRVVPAISRWWGFVVLPDCFTRVLSLACVGRLDDLGEGATSTRPIFPA